MRQIAENYADYLTENEEGSFDEPVLKRMRSRNVMTPVLIFTAQKEIEDRVAGLDSGADGYLDKPFAMDERHTRVRA